MKLAITGGTGFVGSRLVEAAIDAGHQVSALTRRPMPTLEQVTWVTGDLENKGALDELVAGAEAVVHVAGVISGRTAEEFDRGNVEGTRAVLNAAEKGKIARFVHVSSLAAREPKLSLYGASKAAAEGLVAASGIPFAIVRPPAVYGPGDRETLELFRMTKLGLVLLPPRGQLSLVHVDDLARLLLVLAAPSGPAGVTIEPDDGRHGGWTHREFAKALGRAVGRRGLNVPVPAAAIRLGARIDQVVRGDRAKLTADRAAYFCHPDWVVDPARKAPPGLWTPSIATDEGLAATARWYRDKGWL